MFTQRRLARISKLATKQSATTVTDLSLIAAPGQGSRIHIDFLYFNISVAGSVEFKAAVGAWTDPNGVLGGTFGAAGGVATIADFDLPDNTPLVMTTTGTTPTVYVTILYHIEQ